MFCFLSGVLKMMTVTSEVGTMDAQNIMKIRLNYHKWSGEQRYAIIEKYASECGNNAAVRHFISLT